MKDGNMLAEFLKEKRLQARLSQGDVSKKLGYTSPQFVSNWERGLSSPPVTTLKKLAGIYGVDAEKMKSTYLDSQIELLKQEIENKFNPKPALKVVRKPMAS